MTERDPSYASDLCYTAESERLLLGGLVCTEGVKSFDDLRVTANSPADNTVIVSAGGAFVYNDYDLDGGMYYVYNDAPVQLTVPDNNTGSPRVDTVWIRVGDSEYAAVTSGFTLVYLDGVDVPVDAANYAYYLLASLTIPSGGTPTVTGTPDNFGSNEGMIFDARSTYVPCGGYTNVHDTIVYENSTTFVKADYPNAKAVRVRVVGGGGGSGAAQATTATSNIAIGTGGAGGGYAESIIPIASLPDSVTVTVGAGGAGNGGADGGTSSFGGLVVATGGKTGTNGTPLASLIALPATPPGAGTVGDIKISGGYADVSFGVGSINIAYAGSGGSSHMGVGGRGSHSETGAAPPSTGWGGGAGAAANRINEAAKNGIAGRQGVVIVEILG